jgi:two-component system NtrC family sensor kinase
VVPIAAWKEPSFSGDGKPGRAHCSALPSEVQSLTRSIDHIKEIVSTQRSYAGSISFIEAVEVDELMEDAVRMNATSINRHGIVVSKDFAQLPQLLLDKHLVLQILINLIGNAKQTLQRAPECAQAMTLRTRLVDASDGAKAAPAQALTRPAKAA